LEKRFELLGLDDGPKRLFVVDDLLEQIATRILVGC
jgi:hypothetical protein